MAHSDESSLSRVMDSNPPTIFVFVFFFRPSSLKLLYTSLERTFNLVTREPRSRGREEMRPSAPGCVKNVSTTQLFLVYIEMGKSSLETMSGHNCDVNSARFFCCCYLSVTYMYLAFLTNNIEIKSLASSDMTSKLS